MFRQVGTDRRGRPEGSIIEVIERVNQSVVARLYCERGVWFAVPEDRRLNQDILIEPDGHADGEHGQVVMVELIEQPTPADQIEVLAELSRLLPIPIMADESVQTPHDALEIARRSAADVIALARKTRNDLDSESVFGQTFSKTQVMARWRSQRDSSAGLEAQDLITRLNILPDLPPQVPLSQYGLASSPDAARVRPAASSARAAKK